MCEAKEYPKTSAIIELMGKENKKQTRKTHQAIIGAFRDKRAPLPRPNPPIESPD